MCPRIPVLVLLFDRLQGCKQASEEPLAYHTICLLNVIFNFCHLFAPEFCAKGRIGLQFRKFPVFGLLQEGAVHRARRRT